MFYQNSSLILEGGGLRGIFTAGVLDCFIENCIDFASCIGVSAGSCHACSYISKQLGRARDVSVDYLDCKGYGTWREFLKTGDFFAPDLLYDKFPNEFNLYDYETAAASKTDFRAVVTNCVTGKAEYPRLTDAHRDIVYVQASSSLPLFSNIVFIDGKPYLDGGIADSIPVKYAFDAGYTKNVVVLTQPRSFVKEKSKSMPLIRAKYGKKYPELVRAMENRHIDYNNSLKLIADKEKSGELFVISPPEIINIGRIEKNREKLLAAYKSGYDAAVAGLDSLLTFLK